MNNLLPVRPKHQFCKLCYAYIARHRYVGQYPAEPYGYEEERFKSFLIAGTGGESRRGSLLPDQRNIDYSCRKPQGIESFTYFHACSLPLHCYQAGLPESGLLIYREPRYCTVFNRLDQLVPSSLIQLPGLHLLLTLSPGFVVILKTRREARKNVFLNAGRREGAAADG